MEISVFQIEISIYSLLKISQISNAQTELSLSLIHISVPGAVARSEACPLPMQAALTSGWVI